MVEPVGAVEACAVVLPDADQTPEQVLAGTFVRSLAESGVKVVIPTVIDLTSRWSGHPDIKMTKQPHREWIYRQAFHMGRHVIGYEVQKVLAAVDWFRARHSGLRIGVSGQGEGGLVALYAAAADTRIDAALVGGYFASRQGIGTEPIYHNVWGLLTEFGDAELAAMIAPRGLVIEKGSREEFERIGTLVPSGFQPRVLVEDGLADFGRQLGVRASAPKDAAGGRSIRAIGNGGRFWNSKIRCRAWCGRRRIRGRSFICIRSRRKWRMMRGRRSYSVRRFRPRSSSKLPNGIGSISGGRCWGGSTMRRWLRIREPGRYTTARSGSGTR